MPSKEEIAEYRAMVAVAKKSTISIGVCLGKKATSAVVLLDRKKQPAALAREAKKAGETAKVAAGKLKIDGTDATFLAEEKPPGELAKQLKGFFAAVGVKLTFNVLLPDGKPAPQDPDDPVVPGSPEAAALETASEVEEVKAEPEEVEEEEAAEDGSAALLARLKALEPRIAEVTGGPEATLKALASKAAELVAGGVLDKAELAISRLEEALDKLPAAAAPAPNPGGAILDKLQALVTPLSQSPGRRAMEALLAEERDFLAQGKSDRLKTTARRIQEGVQLQAALDALAPRIAQAAARLPDPKTLTALFAHLAGNVPAPDQSKAMAAVERIGQMLQGPAAAAPAPIATLRQDWVATRSRMAEELRKLQSAIEAACREVGGLEGVIANLPRLLAPLARIDARLEDKLAALAEAQGVDRDKLAAEARDIVKAYRAELAQPFFREVDGGNGFATVAVTATAEATLARVETALAA